MNMKWTEVIEALEYEIEDHEFELKMIETESQRRHSLKFPPWKEDGRTFDEELHGTVDFHKEFIEAFKIARELVRGQMALGFTDVRVLAEGWTKVWKA
jgi:hypothetical protein